MSTRCGSSRLVLPFDEGDHLGGAFLRCVLAHLQFESVEVFAQGGGTEDGALPERIAPAEAQDRLDPLGVALLQANQAIDVTCPTLQVGPAEVGLTLPDQIKQQRRQPQRVSVRRRFLIIILIFYVGSSTCK